MSALEEVYAQMSGTSAATPPVSGNLAAFLLLRRECISIPNRETEILLGNYSDLPHEVSAQEAGPRNLIKMMALNSERKPND
jgi:hypothetical protein